MKPLIFKIVIPLTIISFTTITKWWYALPVDAPDTIFTGFPFPYMCSGWHTSMSLQFFMSELIADLLIYFLFWLVVIFCINRFLLRIDVPKTIVTGLWVCSICIVAFTTLLTFNKDNLFYLSRPFDMEVIETGFQIGWQQMQKPEFTNATRRQDNK